MFFGRKKKSKVECEECGSKVSDSYSFCPYCGSSIIDEEKEMKDFGLLGRNSSRDNPKIEQNPFEGFGITDKMLNSLMGGLMKSLGKQMKDMEASSMENTEVRSIPNGISIRIGPRASPQATKQIASRPAPTEAQLEKMSKLPRTTAKSSVKRFSDRIVYELKMQGVESANDVFISKLESGYEIKAIGEKRVYVNSIPLELPLKSFSVQKDFLILEFLPKANQ